MIDLIKSACYILLFFQWTPCDASLDPIVFEPCNSGLDFIEFDWNDVAGATCYELTITNLTTGIVTTEIIPSSEFFIAGLSENEEIEMQVVAKSGDPTCNSTATTFCATTACAQFPPLSFNPCLEEPGAITFSWDAIVGISEYIVTNAADNIPITQSEVEYTVTGLDPLQEVTITVQAIHPMSSCAISPTTISCTTPCPDLPLLSNIVCADSGIDFVSFSWDDLTGINGYEVTWQINNGVELTDTIQTSELNFPGELWPDQLNAEDQVNLSVTPINVDPQCGNGIPQTATCAATGCPVITFTNLNQEVCWTPTDGPIQLLLGEVLDDDGNVIDGDIKWEDSEVDALTGLFMPSNTEASMLYTISYEFSPSSFPGACIYSGSFFIQLNIQPSPSLSLVKEAVCIGDPIMLMGIASPDPQVERTFDFDGGEVVLDNWPEQIDLVYQIPGTKTVTLTETSAPNCSVSSMINFEVVEADAIIISCEDVTASSVTFVWDAIPEALGYNYSIDGGPTSLIPETSIVIDGLNIDEEVTIVVTGFFDPTQPCAIVGTASCITEGINAADDLANKELTIYPNPVTDILYLAYPAKEFEVKLLTVDCQIISQTVRQNKLDVSHLESGIYLLVYSDRQNGKKTTERIMVY